VEAGLVSVQALTWVLDFSPAKGGDRLVLISLANHAHRDGSDAHPKVDTIAREAGGMAERTVQYALYSLEHGHDGSGVAIRREGLGPNRAVNWRVLMDQQAAAFVGIPRRLREGANVAPPDSSHVAPLGVQHLQSEGATCASRVRHPAVNRPETVQPPNPPEGGFTTSEIGPALTPWPASGRQRDRAEIETVRAAELAAWLAAHPATSELQAQTVELLAAAAARVTESIAAIWIAPLHAHQVTDTGIALGTKPELAVWTGDRYGSLLRELAQRPVVIFGCPCAGYDFAALAGSAAA
jgi:hypothetical protein